MNTAQKTHSGLSLCMIVRDEEFSLENTLLTARPHVDEMIIVDTGSTDQTLSIAKKYANRVEHFKWIDDFSAARNYSLSFATEPWILVLDADEIIAPDDYAKLKEASRSDRYDGFYLTQRRYLGRSEGNSATWKPADPEDPYSKHYQGYHDNPIVRLFRNDESIKYSGAIHELIDPSISAERTGMSDVLIHHYHENPDNDSEQHVLRNLAIQERLIAKNEATQRDYLSAAAAHLRTTKKPAIAEQYLNKVLQIGEDETLEAVALETLAEIYYRDGRLDDATKLYRQLYESKTGSAAVLNNLSNLLIKAGDLESGAYLLQELLHRGIEDPARKERVTANLQAILHAIDRTEKNPEM
jgi:glycosyltransferase involved in cell wall biosynthesis